jgi:hypothetical protein
MKQKINERRKKEESKKRKNDIFGRLLLRFNSTKIIKKCVLF